MTAVVRLKRKASEIAAMRWTATGRNTSDLLAWCRGSLVFALDDDGQTIIGRLATPSGIARVVIGDWILCRNEGDYYPVKHEALLELYDSVEATLPDDPLTPMMMDAPL